MGTHMRVLSESYPMNTNMTGFGWFSNFFAGVNTLLQVSFSKKKTIPSLRLGGFSFSER